MKALSFSELNSFLWNKDDWYKQYVLGEDIERKPEEQLKMDIGSAIHEYLEDQKYPLTEKLRELGLGAKRIGVIRKATNKMEGKMLPEHEIIIRATLKEIPLLAKIDGFDKLGFLDDYKTTDASEEKRWNQYKADYYKQFSFYALVYRLVYHKYLMRIRVWEIHTVKGTCRKFETARGPRDLLYIQNEIMTAVNYIKMKGLWDKRLTRKEREMKNQSKLCL